MRTVLHAGIHFYSNTVFMIKAFAMHRFITFISYKYSSFVCMIFICMHMCMYEHVQSISCGY